MTPRVAQSIDFDSYKKRKKENEITFGKLLDVNLNPEQTKEPLVEKKIASAQLRKNILESQKRNNYRNEYDRITGALQNKNITPAEARNLKNRRKDLKKLAKQSVNPHQHPVFQ